jgi:chromosome segregation ATPase
MQRHAQHDREWEQWPGRGAPDERSRGRLRGLFAPSDAADAVAELIAERGKELEERSAQIRAAVEELEHREERARELHFKVEQILRDGAAELDRRQAELDERAAEIGARETALERAEAKAEDRRRTLGAVELRAAAIERREEAVRLGERDVERRAAELEEREQRLEALSRSLAASGPAPVREDEHVALVAGPRYELVVRRGPAPTPGELLEHGDAVFRCVRVTGSLLPGDDRRCALVEPAPLG